MIRLTHLVPWLGVGGTEGVILDLCRARSAAHFAPTVAAINPQSQAVAGELRGAGARVVTGVEACAAAVRGADLVNLHWVDYDAALYTLARTRPLVTTLHWRSPLPTLPEPTICTSRNALELQPSGSRCVLIPNGVDVERFAAPSRPRRDEVVITRVCRPPKCAPYFWDVVHRILARYPQVRFRIVGNTQPARHPSGRVEYLGVRRDVPQILAESDLFFYTPYPNTGSRDLVVMEASAAGVPCVVSDVSTVNEAVEDGRNGFLTRFGSVDAAVERLSALIEDADLRQRMSVDAARIAREQFDMRRAAAQYEAVYRAVLAGRTNAWRATTA